MTIVAERKKKRQRVKTESGISFVETRKIVQSQAASRNGQSFASAALARVQPGKTQSSCVDRPTQTDLTNDLARITQRTAPLNTFEKSVQTKPMSPIIRRPPAFVQNPAVIRNPSTLRCKKRKFMTMVKLLSLLSK